MRVQLYKDIYKKSLLWYENRCLLLVICNLYEDVKETHKIFSKLR